jgi:hypothetical protein
MAGYSPKYPLMLDPNDGYALLQTLQDVAVQNVRMVLYTEPGERVWDINFGVGIKKYLFEPNLSFTRDQIRSRIVNQLRTYLPYVNIINLEIYAVNENNEISNDGDTNFLKIILRFSVTGVGEITLQETISR